MHADIFLLWEHKAFTCHSDTMNNIPLVFCTVHVTIYFSQKRQAPAANSFPDLHTYWPDIFSMIIYTMFAPNTTMAPIVMAVRYRLM